MPPSSVQILGSADKPAENCSLSIYLVRIADKKQLHKRSFKSNLLERGRVASSSRQFGFAAMVEPAVAPPGLPPIYYASFKQGTFFFSELQSLHLSNRNRLSHSLRQAKRLWSWRSWSPLAQTQEQSAVFSWSHRRPTASWGIAGDALWWFLHENSYENSGECTFPLRDTQKAETKLF